MVSVFLVGGRSPRLEASGRHQERRDNRCHNATMGLPAWLDGVQAAVDLGDWAGALRLLDGTDELTQQLRAQANLVSARTIYAVTQPATVRAAAPQSPAERTPAPPAAGG